MSVPDVTRRRAHFSALLTLASVALGVAVSGCGASDPIALTQASRTVGTTAHSGGLTISLAVAPTRAATDSPIRFKASAYERHAGGAFGYRLAYGDGSVASSGALPLFCIAGNAPPANRTWSFTHRYKRPGSYRALLDVYVNCTSDRATVAAVATVTGR